MQFRKPCNSKSYCREHMTFRTQNYSHLWPLQNLTGCLSPHNGKQTVNVDVALIVVNGSILKNLHDVRSRLMFVRMLTQRTGLATMKPNIGVRADIFVTNLIIIMKTDVSIFPIIEVAVPPYYISYLKLIPDVTCAYRIGRHTGIATTTRLINEYPVMGKSLDIFSHAE